MCGDLMYKGVIYSKIDISTSFAVHTQNGKRLALLLLQRPNETVKSTLSLCSATEWNESVLICEKEIERRGLHVDNPKERFEL
jgi:hypothetical protein